MLGGEPLSEARGRASGDGAGQTRRDRTARDAPLTVARHARLRRHAWWRTALVGAASLLAVVLVSGASLAAIVTNQLASNIDTVEIGITEAGAEAPRIGPPEGGFTVLIVGIDNLPGQADEADRDGATLNDANLLITVAEDQQSAVAVSIPRDLIVPIPSCPYEDGTGSYSAMSAQQFNVAYSYGGLNCVVLAAQKLTELPIDYAGLIGFDGVANMATAIGGVDVCITAPIDDPGSGLVLPEAGEYSLEGQQAIQFLRTRYGIGDGGDLSRISSQQSFLSSMIRKLQSEGTLTDLPTIYALAQAMTQSMKLSTGLASADTLVSMAQVLAALPPENIVFTQYPGTIPLSGPNTGRVIPDQAAADALFERIRSGERFVPEAPQNGTEAAPGGEGGVDAPAEPAPDASGSADPTPAPGASTPPVLEGVPGQTAAEARCAVGRG